MLRSAKPISPSCPVFPPSHKQTLGSLSTSIQRQISTDSMLHSNYQAFYADITIQISTSRLIGKRIKKNCIAIHRVQLANFEDSVMVPPNWNLLLIDSNRPNSDWLVYRYAWSKGSSRGVDVQVIVLQHQLSHLGNNKSITVLLKHMGDENPRGCSH